MAKLQAAWIYDVRPPGIPDFTAPRHPTGSQPYLESLTSWLSEAFCIYKGTPYNHVVALEPETRQKVWDYEGDSAPSREE